MTLFQSKERILVLAVRLIILAVILMVIVIPGVYSKTLTDGNNIGAVIGISLAILIRLLILRWLISLIRKIRRNVQPRKSAYVAIAMLLILFGLFYSDGAIAFLDKKNVRYVSYLMFTSVLLDLLAAVLSFVAMFTRDKTNK